MEDINARTLLRSTSGTASSSEPKLVVVLLCGNALSVMVVLPVQRETLSKSSSTPESPLIRLTVYKKTFVLKIGLITKSL